MKRIILVLGLLLTTLNSTAQDSKTSMTLGYPLPVGDNFIGGYNGIIDLGLQSRFADIGPVKIGVSANASYLRVVTELGSIIIKENAFLVQPRLFGELNIKSISKLKPFLGLGYSFCNFNTKFDESNNEPDRKNNNGGLNVNLGTAYDISDRWFIHLQYDATKLSREGQGQELAFSNNITLLKLGLGLRF